MTALTVETPLTHPVIHADVDDQKLIFHSSVSTGGMGQVPISSSSSEEDAKQAAFAALNPGPVNVIQKFVKPFLAVYYRVPLSGKATA